MSPKKPISRQEALSRAMRYCAWQERCVNDVRRKLMEWGFNGKNDIEQIINELKKENFIDEQRFAKSFARGKLNQNHWGQKKIREALKEKSVDEQLIEEAIEELSEDDYNNILKELAREKYSKIGGETREKTMKLKRFLYQRGFESQEIEDVIKTIKE